MKKVLFFAITLVLSIGVKAQTTANESISLQACQGDSLQFSFDITSAFNPSNLFSVEMSNSSGIFSGNFVNSAPLLAYGVQTGYLIDVVIPDATPQGLYKFRLVGTDPAGFVSDTISNVIIGANPSALITAYNYWDKAGFLTICEGDTGLLVANRPPIGQTYTYQWRETGNPLSGEINDTLLVTESGVYSVEVSSNLCDATSNDTIMNTYTPPTAVFANNTPGVQYIGKDSIQMCYGTVATLEYFSFPAPGINGYSYQWLKNDSLDIFGDTVWYALPNDTLPTINVDTTGQWFLQVTSDPGGCIDTSVAFWVFVDTIPASPVDVVLWPGQSLPKTTLCLTDSVMLSAQDTVLNDSWVYQWQVSYPSGSGNWQNLLNDTLPWLVVDTSIVADTADYRLYIINETCDYISNETTVEFVNFPTINILPGDSLGICAYDSVLVSLNSNALTFSWNNGLFNGKQNYIADAGQYVIVATGVNQCKSYDTLDVFNYTLVASASATPAIVSPGETTTLFSSGGVGYYWWSDYPSTFSNQHASSTTTLPGADTTTYFIEVVDNNGCFDTASVTVFVVEQDTNVINNDIYGNLQNVITPNGDGMNDVLDLSGVTDGDDCEFTVYTRWGTPVYNQAIYTNDWSGTTDGGSQLEDGTYYYVLTFDNAIRIKAAITVLNNF
jgi:gliding motility-associated-like protein